MNFNKAPILSQPGSNKNIQKSPEPTTITILRIPSVGGATSSESDEDSQEPKSPLHKEIIYEKGILPASPDQETPRRPTKPQTGYTANPVPSNPKHNRKNHSLNLPGGDSPDCAESFSINTPSKSLVNFNSAQRKGFFPAMLKAPTPAPDNPKPKIQGEASNFKELVEKREKALMATEALKSPPDNLESIKRHETRGSLNFYDDCSPIAEVEEELASEHSIERGAPEVGDRTIGKRISSDLLDTSCVGVLGMALPELTGNGSPMGTGKLGNSQFVN